jgi:methionine-rich copper-binding protein CopC
MQKASRKDYEYPVEWQGFSIDGHVVSGRVRLALAH